MKHDYVLSSPRLTLRPFKSSDAQPTAALAGDPKVANHLLNIPEPYTTDMAAHWIHSIGMSGSPHYIWAVTLTSNKALVGSIGLHDVNLMHKKADLGYWIASLQQKKGFATESAQTVIEFAFTELKLNRIQATTEPGNNPSARVLEKLGFSLEGTLKEYYCTSGQFRDAAIYSLLEKNYKH